MPDPAVPAPPSVPRRVAAAVALLALLTALAVVLTAVLRDPLRALLLPVLLLACVTAAWTALVNVDGRRIVAALVALVAFVALAALLLAGPLLRTALVVVLVVIAVGAAQLAVARDLVHGPGERRPVGAARHGVLFLNPWSGGGAVARSGLVQRTRELGVDPVLLGEGEDLRELAERAVARGADVIGMAGGDGSQAVVADVARRHDVAFVCVPAGTRNHFALDLGLDRADLRAGGVRHRRRATGRPGHGR
ncbi:Diacylglycerol kinase catalytic domain-containing protein [Pseudonocardia ammonioxydans]|uniref:Diacylglycerol kinase catalytic domain-containing protein n=1 Tax=Pseudonocardia ammonioxydans TaxID=260086 RepID=A0A1I4X3Z6_PSUAM|nr:acylglycerol kinase family protein [Pseudonocardia ammonioxydans]SFN20193.1 Diacylglycerol kinase catalytic domain-containing protein [Pseudonocardia ammonioxydans]